MSEAASSSSPRPDSGPPPSRAAAADAAGTGTGAAAARTSESGPDSTTDYRDSLPALILETADEGFCLFSAGPEPRIAAYNQRFAEILDLDEAWLADSPSVEAVARAVYERQRRKAEDEQAHIDRVLDHHRRPGDRELVIELRDGRWITGRTRAAATGERLYTFRDVTAERTVLRELQAERQRLSLLVEHAPVAYYVMDARSGHTRQISRSIRNLTGKPSEAFIGLSREWVDHLHPEDRPRVLAVIEDALRRHVPFDLDYRYQHADGSWRWLRELAEPISVPDEMPPQMAGVVFDITEQKIAENDLRESEQRFRELIEGMPDFVFYEHDLERRLTYVSPSAYRILGYRPDELVGHRFDDFSPAGIRRDDKMDLAEEMVRTAIRTKHRQPQYEVVLRTKGGRAVVSDIVEYPVVVDGEVVAFRGVARDVTSVRDMQRRLRERERLAVLGTFAGGLAHDLNNLLLPIRAALDGIERSPDPKQVRERAASIRQATNHMAELTRKLLVWTRHESAESAKHNEVEDVRAWVERASEFFREAVSGTWAEQVEHDAGTEADADAGDARSEDEAPPIRVRLDVGDPPRSARIDPDLLQQAGLNLFLNARDAMPGGGTIRLRVERSPRGWTHERHVKPAPGDPVSTPLPPPVPAEGEVDAFADEEPGVRLLVSDQGCGMDRKTIERAFDPFFSTKARGKSTGLGLALVHSIVTSCGGHVRIESELGAGTSIILDVPGRDDASATLPGAASGADSGAVSGGHALVALGDPRTAAFVKQSLGREGLVARTGPDDRPGPQDVLWLLEPDRVDPSEVRAALDAQPDLLVVAFADPEDGSEWPESVLWLGPAIHPAVLRRVIHGAGVAAASRDARASAPTEPQDADAASPSGPPSDQEDSRS